CGFFSKFPIILSGFQEKQYVISGIALLVGLLTLFSMIKIFSYAFWGKQQHSNEQSKRSIGAILLPMAPLVMLTIVLVLAAESLFQYSLQIAVHVMDPSIYIESVLKELYSFHSISLSL